MEHRGRKKHMHKTKPIRLAALPLVIILLCFCGSACSPAAGVSATLSTGATVTPTPSPSPIPASTPTASPTPSLPPTPSPSPTPTPDPWAEHFTKSGAYLSVADPDKGPWLYRDETLSIRIDLITSGKSKYLRAEIYTRGPLPMGAFAYQDTRARKTALPYLLARQNKAVFGITDDFVTHHKNDKGVMIRLGKVYYDKKKAPTLAVLPDGELRVYEPGKATAKELLALGVKDSFAFGPILVNNGQIHKTVRTHPLRPSNKRSSIGMVEKGHYICIVTLTGFTLKGLAELYLQNNCKVAYNLDGGHSASMVFMGEQLFRCGYNDLFSGQRPLPDMLVIGHNDAVPDPKAPVYCNGNSYNKKYKPKPMDGPLN